VTAAEARDLLRPALPAAGDATARWADLGAGRGTFTRALAELLGPAGVVYAVERDPGALAALRALAAHSTVVVAEGDFTRPLPALPVALDGLLLANALHFVPDAAATLARLTSSHLAPGGRVVAIEYDRRPPSRWVPYPIDADRLPALAASAGLGEPTIVATRPSTFGGRMYVGVMERR
jgi:SAM-dependent methyltransferase